MAKRTFPTMVNKSLEERLYHRAEFVVKRFNLEIFPLLLKFGLLDDKHIEKYLGCDTIEEIYKDALAENPSSIYALEQQAFIEELKENPEERADVWGFLRGSKSEAKSPKEAGFIFKPIPGADQRNRKLVLKALSVKNLTFSIDRELLREASIIHPTDEQIELYNMLSEFCEAYNSMTSRKPITHILSTKSDGTLYPNVHSILGATWIYDLREA